MAKIYLNKSQQMYTKDKYWNNIMSKYSFEPKDKLNPNHLTNQ